MTPIRLSNTWAQRFYVGLFLLSLLYVALYSVEFVAPGTLAANLKIETIPAIAAGITAIGSIIGFFTVKKITSFLPALGAFALFAVTSAYITQATGGVSSPLLFSWTLVAFFAPLFGAYGWLPVFVMIGTYTAGAYLSGDLTVSNGLIIGLSSLVPLAAGMIIWRDPPGTEDASAKNVKHLASQLSEVAQKSEIVINAIGDGVIAVDGKGVIQLINPAAQQILGWGKQDALMLSYKSIFKLVDENGTELDQTVNPVEQVLNTNQQVRGKKLVAITQSGKKINVAVVVSPIGNAGTGAIAVFRDVTNERAEEREQAEFISTASHEMRTPVASIEGYLGLALNPNTATIDQKARDFILKAHEAAQHLGRLFQDLLDVSKSEDGRMTNTPKVVDVVTFTQTITQGLTQKATEKGLQLVFKPVGNDTQRKIMPVYYVNQDNDHIREILDNLIENAIKYTPQGNVTVDVTGTDEKVVISIEDTGLGIPPEDVPHLFQKFYRVNNADRQAIGGTGLGLYLARRLAEAMQGRLWVESDFGKGSTFFLELPRVDSQEADRLKEQQEVAAKAAIPATPIIPSQPAAQPTPPTSIPVVSIESAPAVTPAPAPAPATAPTLTPTPAPTPATATPMPAPAAAPSVSPAPAQSAITSQQPTPASATTTAAPVVATRSAPQPAVRPATTVPRGESLTAEQKAARVKQLEALSQQQRGGPPPR